MHLSCFHLPAEQPHGDKCSLLPSSARGNGAKPDFEKQSAARPYSVTRRGAWHVFIHSWKFTRGCVWPPVLALPVTFTHSSFLSTSVSFSIIHQCQRKLHTRRSPSHSVGSIIRVPSATFNISNPSVLLGDMMSSTEGFVKFYTFLFYLEFKLVSNLCLLLNVTVCFIVSDDFRFIYGLFGLKMFKASACGWNLPNYVCIAGDNS